MYRAATRLGHVNTVLVQPRRLVRDILSLARPRFWLTSVVAIHLGFVLATQRLVPRGDEIVTMAIAGIVTGPLLWISVLAVNDAHDLENDRANPRKAAAPLVTGRISRSQALRISAVAGGLATCLALTLGWLFALGTAATVLLGWAYSAPPLRLKARAGTDVAANAIAVGVLGPLGGWVAINGTTDGFPWALAAIGIMAGSALYLPTTMADRESDAAYGARTTAVALGQRATFELGFALWTGSAALAFVLAASDTVIDRSILPIHIMMAPLLLALYRSLLQRDVTFTKITIVAAAYLVPCTAFVVTYVQSI